jgi:hypothetical protein
VSLLVTNIAEDEGEITTEREDHMNRLNAARAFLETHGRDIDRARFDYHFGDGSQDAVLEALSHYQNEDGGFGHGLEPDISAPVSNPFATELALAIFSEVGAPGDHPMVQSTVRYLEDTQREEGDWQFSPEVYEHPLAPWFQGWTWPTLNPGVTTSGLLRVMGLGSDRLHARAERLFQQLATPNDLLGDEYYAVRPYSLYFLSEWDHPQRELYLSGIVWWLIRQDAAGTLPDAFHYLEYVRGPETYVGRHLPRRLITARLDQLEREQAEDGGWPVAYADHWRAPTTVESLLMLHRFGRLESRV